MSKISSMHGDDNTYRNLVGTSVIRGLCRDQGIYGKMMLKWFLDMGCENVTYIELAKDRVWRGILWWSCSTTFRNFVRLISTVLQSNVVMMLRYSEVSVPSHRGRGDEWADPWMRSKSPSARKTGSGSRPSRRQSYSSGSSYSSSRLVGQPILASKCEVLLHIHIVTY